MKRYVKATTTQSERQKVIKEAKKLIKETYKALQQFDQPAAYISQPYKDPGMFGYGVGNDLQLCWGEERYHYDKGHFTEWSITVGGAYEDNPKAEEIINRLVKYLSDNEKIIWDWNNPEKSNPDYQHYQPIFKTGMAWSCYGIMLRDYSKK